MTIEEIIYEKYRYTEQRKEAFERVRQRLGLSVPHFYRKRKGESPLTLSQAKIVANTLKIPISKLS